MRRIVWSAPAVDDLRGIDDWLTRNADPEHAVQALEAVRRCAAWLVDFPRGGRPHRDGARVLRIYGTPYLIRYIVTDDRVEVLRVHHERENWHVAP
ncbi:type II toxin-antitoxin system RelE/ParE family toxin [Sphingomonas rubra]|uniref:type II toxin-antitoxin system RelE/ParE family toxin n=1 Tax=Sphingomonas rubra TaxID=634430 RepID=UPI000B814352